MRGWSHLHRSKNLRVQDGVMMIMTAMRSRNYHNITMITKPQTCLGGGINNLLVLLSSSGSFLNSCYFWLVKVINVRVDPEIGFTFTLANPFGSPTSYQATSFELKVRVLTRSDKYHCIPYYDLLYPFH